MTNQSVVVSADSSSSGIELTITVAIKNSVIYSSSALKPPQSPGSYITISRKFPRKVETIKTTDQVETNKINAWVDSMRASSPTHVRPSTASLSDGKNYSSWMVINNLFKMLFHKSLIIYIIFMTLHLV